MPKSSRETPEKSSSNVRVASVDTPGINVDGINNQSYNLTSVKAEAFSGPLPSPQVLKGYAEMVPDAPERILRMAETSLAHDMEMDKKNCSLSQCGMDYGYKTARRGQIFALIMGLLLVISGVVLTVLGFEKIGLTIFSTTLVGTVGLFLTTLVSKTKKNQEK